MDMLIHQGALGDWVLTWPLLRALAASAARPVLAVTAGAKARLAARVIPGVEAVDIEQADLILLHAPGGAARVSPAWRRRFAGLRRVVSFVSTGSDAWAENLRALAPQASCAFVDPRPPQDWPGHVVEWYARQVAGIPDLRFASRDWAGIPGDRRGDRGTARQIGNRESKTGNPRPLVLHPGSGGRAKCWPVGRFEALMLALRSHGPVQPILGEVELDTWPAAAIEHWQRDLAARVVTSLDELHALLSAAAAFVGNDAGPTHLAAALGVPTVALYGPTAPVRWAPLGPSVTVLAPPEPMAMTWLETGAVMEALLRLPGWGA